MLKPFKKILDSIKEDLGSPASLYHLIESMPELRATLVEPAKSICAHDIVPWHTWGTPPVIANWPHRARGQLMGWRYSSGSYASFIEERDEFINFGTCHRDNEWTCDIQEITGLATSKSPIHEFSDLDEFVEIRSPELIDTITEENLRKNLAHNEIRILIPGNTDDFLIQHRWDGRLFLMNYGGSHHFAAARYIASRLNVPVPIRGKLLTYGINPKALNSLQQNYDIFVISNIPENVNGFFDAMMNFRATYLWQLLPRPYDDKRAVMLPKNEPRSAEVAKVLRSAGFFDLVEHLNELKI